MTESTADPRLARLSPEADMTPDIPSDMPVGAAGVIAPPPSPRSGALPESRPEPLPAGAAADAGAQEAAAAPSNVRPLAGRRPRQARPWAKPASGPARPGPGGERPAPEPNPAPVRPLQPVPATTAARARPRHYVLLASFLCLVVLPLLATVSYLWFRAAPEYHSETAFSVRSEGPGGAAAGILGALTQIGGGGSASDVNVLYDFIRSQEIVERVGARLDLRTIWNRAEGDPFFAYGEDPSTEGLLAYWRRMVQVDLEASEGIITVKSFAFTPEDAQAITRAVLDESNALVNQLSDKARADAVSFSQSSLAEVERRLRGLRQQMADFRREHRMIDPSADVASQTGLLNALQGELAHALVERDMLLSYTGPTDQRVVQADRRIDAITRRIEAERNSLQGGGQGAKRGGRAGAAETSGDASGDATATVAAAVGEGALPEILNAYEELKVDLEFANTAYTHALAAVAAAQAEASRQSRYLVPHVQPTLADTSLYPRKLLITGTVGLFLFLGWSVLLLVYYNVRDNR